MAIALGGCDSAPKPNAQVRLAASPTASSTPPETTRARSTTANPFRLRDGSTATIEGDEVVFVDGYGKEVDRQPCGFNGIDYRRAVAVITGFQSAITRREESKAASLVLFPLNWSDGHRNRLVRSRVEFVESFDKLFPPTERRAIAKPDPLALMCNYQGFMLGDGVVWGSVDGQGRYGVITVQPPVPGD